jgi:hypothetical protein
MRSQKDLQNKANQFEEQKRGSGPADDHHGGANWLQYIEP